MELGAFSISLNVKDIQASLKFYETLGFEVFGGEVTQGWVILKHGTTTLGLFQGMFPRNMLTFNPRWNSDAQAIEDGDDIRSLQKAFTDQGIKIDPLIDENSTGPASFMLEDPDGNPILFDQHL